MKENILASLSCINTVENMIRPVLVNALKANIILPGMEAFAGGASNLYELWVNDFGDRFFQMGNFIRLGSEMEKGFREFYLEQKGCSSLAALDQDKAIKQGVFQKLNGKNTLQNLYRAELGIALEAIPEFQTFKEFMISRHLYTHTSGLLNEKYLAGWLNQTGEELRSDPVLQSTSYPQEDVYWFRPLGKLNEYYQACVSVIKALP